nr:probable glycerol-3-phosphate acyltransferase 8 [Tanacetum cinerariifolium]
GLGQDIELASRAVLPRFYAADVRSDSFDIFDKCERKVVVTANPTIMVDAFVKEYLGGDKVLGTEIEVNEKTKRATGFVKEPGVLVGKWKKIAMVKEFGDESPDIGLGDRKSDHDFMSVCKRSEEMLVEVQGHGADSRPLLLLACSMERRNSVLAESRLGMRFGFKCSEMR